MRMIGHTADRDHVHTVIASDAGHVRPRFALQVCGNERLAILRAKYQVNVIAMVSRHAVASRSAGLILLHFLPGTPLRCVPGYLCGGLRPLVLRHSPVLTRRAGELDLHNLDALISKMSEREVRHNNSPA